MLGGTLSADDASSALEPVGTRRLAECDVLRHRGDRIASPLRITPFDGAVFVHDPDEHLIAAQHDHVVGVGGATRTLASVTVRLPVGRALDIGTGCGVQAILAARHSDEVVATDLNARALEFAELNAALNGCDNVRTALGSLYEPVAGESFDLVVSNPPFVISPDDSYLYRDSGLPGDEISRQVLAGLGSALAEGGYASVLCEWTHARSEHWSKRPLSWLEGTGCDSWLLGYKSEDPRGYATFWNQGLRRSDPDAFVGAVDRWSEYHRELGIDAIATGALIARRRGGPNWIRVDDLRAVPQMGASEQILLVFEAGDHLHELSDDRALTEERIALVAGNRLDQTLVYEEGRYAARDAYLSLERGAGVVGTVPAEFVHVLFRLDGTRSLGTAVAEAAEDLGEDPADYGERALAVIRELFAAGLVRRA